jgi:hypothetical protein
MLRRESKPLIKLIVFSICIGNNLNAQNYTYRHELENRELRRSINRYLRESRLDSLSLVYERFDNRLGFLYYQCKAIVLANKQDSLSKCYLDSAFMRGLTPLCLGKNITLFDSIQVKNSFKSNYLKAYNIALINRIDSMHYKDQEYRQKAVELMRMNETDKSQQSSGNKSAETSSLKLSKSSYQLLIDSLWEKQKEVDSTNLILLKEIIKNYGWPSAKMIGHYYCQRGAADVSILIMHLGTHEREYQIEILQKVIDLCERNEESWGIAESLIFNLHSRFRNEFSEFSFLNIEAGKLNPEKSFFSIFNMANLLITGPKYQIEIKCKNETLFKEIKAQMIQVNESFPWIDYKKSTRPVKALEDADFLFISSPELDQNMVLYKLNIRN